MQTRTRAVVANVYHRFAAGDVEGGLGDLGGDAEGCAEPFL